MDHDAPVQDMDGSGTTSSDNLSDHARNDALAGLSDELIVTLLEEYRARTTVAGEFDAAIIELELEAVRRNLQLPAMLELMPPGLALVRCRYWLGRGNTERAAQCMWDLSMLGALRLYDDIHREWTDDVRVSLMESLLYVLDTGRFGGGVPQQRAALVNRSMMDKCEIEAFLRSALHAHFNDWMMFRSRP
jgi:hypothetical protein